MHTQLDAVHAELRTAERNRDQQAGALEHANQRLTEARTELTELTGARDDAQHERDTQRRRADRAEARADTISEQNHHQAAELSQLRADLAAAQTALATTPEAGDGQ